jgi:hypothetical protein
MAVRTDAATVQAVLGNNYQAGVDLTRFIAIASKVVDRVVTCAAAKSVSLSAAVLAEMEAWLAAHYYTRSDPTYKSRTTNRASGVFNADGSEFKNAAMELDSSGCLSAILSRKTASVAWLGKTETEQIAYPDRQ